MKIKNGFVSNSSSSSFLINKRHLSSEQIESIKDHKNCGLEDADTDAWTITENKHQIKGYTDMDNFSMDYFLTEIMHINREIILWD
jgi:hypothetical protein